MSKALNYVFFLSALLIAVAYFVGLSVDAKTVIPGVVDIVKASTGRKSDGSFAGYPQGAALPAA